MAVDGHGPVWQAVLGVLPLSERQQTLPPVHVVESMHVMPAPASALPLLLPLPLLLLLLPPLLPPLLSLPPPPPPQPAIASTSMSAPRWRAKRVGQLGPCKPMKRGRINRKSVLPNLLRDSGEKAESC
jgi:hypothetical protein